MENSLALPVLRFTRQSRSISKRSMDSLAADGGILDHRRLRTEVFMSRANSSVHRRE